MTAESARPRREWRMRAVRRKMSFETFERTVPYRPGWKREYYDGRARVRPSWSYVRFDLDLSPRPSPRVPGLRSLTGDDRDGLRAAFLDSFRFAPEYADYTMAGFRIQAEKYVTGAYGEVRGELSDASQVVVRRGRMLAAAVIKTSTSRPPLLDCLLVRPEAFRHGLATAVVSAALNRLLEDGHKRLESGALLANETSLAWHAAFGFRERPCLFVAEARWRAAAYELERLRAFSHPAEERLAELDTLASRWSAEAARLREIEFPRSARSGERT